MFRVYFSRSSRPEVFCKKGVLEIFAQENTHVRVSFFLRPATLLKKSLWHRCFPRNFAKFLRTHSPIKHLQWLLLFLTMPKKYCIQINSNFTGNQSWNKGKHFHLFLILMLKKSRFFNVKLILFVNDFYEHIFRSSHLQMFFKISALKNFALLRIKKRLQHRCFRVRICHMMLMYTFFYKKNFVRTRASYLTKS